MIFQTFFQYFRQSTTSEPNPLFHNFMGAGCVFTDSKHVLAGYQPHKKFPCISGIGGHKEKDENYYETAWRETIEEIFDVTSIPASLIPTLRRHLPPRNEQNHFNYIILQYTFEDFHTFLKLCRHSGLHSPLYKKFPRSVMESIRSRAVNPKAEISHLCLLPVIKDFQGRQFIHPAFIQDMKDM